MPWPHKSFGTLSYPVHKSHLVELTGEYGCPRRFKYQQDLDHARDTGAVAREPSTRVSAHLACGTAVHETIARALNNAEVRDHLLRVEGRHLPALDTVDKLTARVRTTFEHELRVAADGRELDFGDDDPAAMLTERVHMIVGLLGTLCKYVRKVLAVEPGFIVTIEGVTYSGHIDLIFEPRDLPKDSGAIGICDWKSGASKPDPLELAHGWEAGIYAAACLRATFLPRETVQLAPHDDGSWSGTVTCVDTADGQTDQVTVHRPSRWEAERYGLEAALQHLASGARHADTFELGAYPKRAYHVHLRDFVPYQKSGTKKAARPEDLAFYGLTRAGSVKYTAGQIRGPGWVPIEMHENNVARLAYRARNVIGTVRMGRFVDLVREHCRRCPFQRDCLQGGYALRGDELAALETELKKAGL